MNRRMILHDFDGIGVFPPAAADIVFAAKPQIKNCIGCFGCWEKTPGKCVIADGGQILPSMLAAVEEVVILSRLCYGGFSPEVKAALDRSIGYIMPFFRTVQGEMHHTMRYDNPFMLAVHFYGGAQDETACSVAGQLVAANAVNLGAGSHVVHFHKSAAAAREVLG